MEKTKYTVKTTTEFRRNYRTAMKRGLDISLLDDVIAKLAMGESLPARYQDHALKGRWKQFRECHVLPDWLLVYKLTDNLLVLTLCRTGTHNDIFEE